MKTDNKDIKFWILVVLLIILILLLIFPIRFGKTNNDSLIPTGNVDVFEIGIGCCNKCNNTEPKATIPVIDEGKNPEFNGGNNSTIPVFNEEEDYNVLGKVFVDDKNGNYIYQKNLDIFNNAAFQYTNKIAPGVSNTYQFVVHNSSTSAVMYNIKMYEDISYTINMRYRLKRNNQYVIGSDNTWVKADELSTSLKVLKGLSADNYTLEWKWFDDDVNDTIAGKNMTDTYKLNIRFYFESAGE